MVSAATRFDFVDESAVRRGSDLRVVFELQQFSGSPVDLSGCTVMAAFKKTVDSTPIVLPAAIVDPPADGAISLHFPATTTADLETGRYFWGISITFGNGDRWRVLEGVLSLVGGIA